MPRVRVHQHVNPLSPFYTQEPTPIDLSKIFADPTKPILLDIGSARGRFLLGMAQAEPSRNYLGVEIREPLVDEANRLADETGLNNIHYAFCNAMLWLRELLKEIPDGLIDTVTIQFPDPWFKKKYAKRRMVTPELVDTIVEKLKTGGIVFVQTDIEFLAVEMFEILEINKNLKASATVENLFPVKTEREKAVEMNNLNIFRCCFMKVPN